MKDIKKKHEKNIKKNEKSIKKRDKKEKLKPIKRKKRIKRVKKVVSNKVTNAKSNIKEKIKQSVPTADISNESDLQANNIAINAIEKIKNEATPRIAKGYVSSSYKLGTAIENKIASKIKTKYNDKKVHGNSITPKSDILEKTKPKIKLRNVDRTSIKTKYTVQKLKKGKITPKAKNNPAVHKAKTTLKSKAKQVGLKLLKAPLKLILAGGKAILALVGGGGLILVIVICLIVVISLINSFIGSDGDFNSNRRIQEFIQMQDTNWQQEEDVYNNDTTIDITDSDNIIHWKEVFVYYTVVYNKYNLEPEELTNYFNQDLVEPFINTMNIRTFTKETYIVNELVPRPEDGLLILQPVEKTKLIVTIKHISALEMAVKYNLSEEQKNLINEFNSYKYDDIWNMVLFANNNSKVQ